MIISQTDNRICVRLTSEDMTELDITYEELDYSNIETRRVLWTLLDEARHKLGRNIHLTQKMIVEAVPHNDGGCSIYFTVNDERIVKNSKKQLIKSGDTKIICSSDNIENLGEFAKILSESGKVIKSELFTDGSLYRIIMWPESDSSDYVESVACEFCDICDDYVSAVTYEHWKMLASPDALGVLRTLSD